MREVRVGGGHVTGEACACGQRRATGGAGPVRVVSGAEVRRADLLVIYL